MGLEVRNWWNLREQWEESIFPHKFMKWNLCNKALSEVLVGYKLCIEPEP